MTTKLLLLFLSCPIVLAQAKLALIQVPVADLLAQSAAKLAPDQNPELFYQKIAIAPLGKDLESCPRQHQALFHELVDILSEDHQEAHVRIFNAYYLDQTTKQKTGSFWTLKKNLVLFDNLKENKQLIPKPINYHYPSRQEKEIITLLEPWYCDQTSQTYSAGTRFKLNPQDQTAYIYNPSQNNFISVAIPGKLTLPSQQRPPDELRKLFVNLIKSWSTPDRQNFIPYTWGGCSVIQKVPVHTFELIQKHPSAYYQIAPFTNQTQTGLDCSGLVLRAAQAVGLPLFYKNTTTLAQELKPIVAQDQILPGDLIWISGHVIVIANPKTGLCLEARDYGHGYGKVQRIYLKKLFAGIQNCDKLKAAHLSGTPLNRIDRNGDVKGKYQIKILKLI